MYGNDLVGAASGYGDSYCEEGIPTEAALLALLAAFGVAFGILYRASTTNTGRKKRDLTFVEKIQDLFWMGKSFRIRLKCLHLKHALMV